MKINDHRTSAWRDAHPHDKSYEWDIFAEQPRTIVVHDMAADTIDTGILDANGNPIYRRMTHPAGFVQLG